MSDLMKRYYKMGDEQDQRKFRRADVNHLPPVESIADAAEHLVAPPKDDSIREAQGNYWSHFQFAAEHLRKRAKFLGLPDRGADGLVEKARASFLEAKDVCESPIEKMLLPWLIMEDYGPKVGTVPSPVYVKGTHNLAPRGDILIVPQFAFVRVRIDFAIIARTKTGMRLVAVECDGEQFHSKSRDTLRDGFLASFGIPTVRASGSEIHARPRDVSVRASVALQETLE